MSMESVLCRCAISNDVGKEMRGISNGPLKLARTKNYTVTRAPRALNSRRTLMNR